MSERFRYGYKVRLKSGGPWMFVHTVLADGTYICSWHDKGVVCYSRFHHDTLDSIAEVPISTLPLPKPYKCGKVHFGPFDIIAHTKSGDYASLRCESCDQLLTQKHAGYSRAARMRALVDAIKIDALAHAAKSKQ